MRTCQRCKTKWPETRVVYLTNGGVDSSAAKATSIPFDIVHLQPTWVNDIPVRTLRLCTNCREDLLRCLMRWFNGQSQ